MIPTNTLQIEDILKYWISVYGVFTADDFLTELKSYDAEMATLENLQKAVNTLIGEGFFIEYKDGLLYSFYILKPKFFYLQIEEREDLQRGSRSQDLMLRFKADGLSIWSEAYRSLLQYLTKTLKDSAQATTLARDLYFSQQAQLPMALSISLVTKATGRRLTTDEMSTLMDGLMTLNNTMPNWLIKGHIPDDLYKKHAPEVDMTKILSKIIRNIEKNAKKSSFNRSMKLKESLDHCSKEQLKDLASFHKIRGRSKMNRETLIDCLEEEILTNVGAYTLGMTEHHLAFLNKKAHDMSTDFAMGCRKDFLERGWGFTATDGYKEIVHIPPDLKALLKKSFKAHKPEITKNTELFRAYTYAVTLFGVMPIDDFIKWASIGLGRIFTKDDFYNLVLNTSAINYDLDTNHIYESSLEQMHQEVYQNIQETCSEGYLAFDKQIFEEATYMEDNFLMPYYPEMITKLEKDKGVRLGLDFIQDVFQTINGEVSLKTLPDNITEMIIEEFLGDQKPRHAQIICNEAIEAFMFYAPAWMNKGRSLESMLPKTITRTEQKIGRNDPCPCGSGKKYKKCCMK